MKNKTIVLPNPLGLHARPATVLSKLVKQLKEVVIIEDEKGKQANAQKMFELLGLGLKQNAKIKVICENDVVCQQIIDAISKGLGDDLSELSETTSDLTNDNSITINQSQQWQPKGDIKSYHGVAASDGLVIGQLHHFHQQHFVLPKQVKSIAEETADFNRAIESAQRIIEKMKNSAGKNASVEQSAIFDAHLSLVSDSDMIADTISLITNGLNAPSAYKQVSDNRITKLSSLDNSNIAARAADIRDVRNHVLNELLGIKTQQLVFDQPVIICAEDLTPSDTARINPKQVLGFITSLGGPTSHSAIIARGMGLPAIVAAGSAVRDIAENTTVIVDGSAGIVYVDPNKQQLASVKQAQKRLQEQKKIEQSRRLEAGQTADGKTIQIAANVNKAKSVATALDAGAEGVGLMRTEFIYLERDSIPSEDIQENAYRQMAQAIQGKPLIIRTLDIGGDKEVPYLGLSYENNAFLGMRGIRLCFERPDLFIPQLRAICRVAKDYDNIHVMFPMIGKLSDWERAKIQLEEVRKDVGADPFPVGVMIEVPSAALIAPLLAKEVDFFSIGTNDLTQYTLAMDRMHPILANQTDALHPAVLQLIAMTVSAAKENGKWVGVCGGAAGDKDAAKILIGLGVTELSMATPEIAGIKSILRQHSLSELESLAKKALSLGSAKAVRQLFA